MHRVPDMSRITPNQSFIEQHTGALLNEPIRKCRHMQCSPPRRFRVRVRLLTRAAGCRVVSQYGSHRKRQRLQNSIYVADCKMHAYVSSGEGEEEWDKLEVIQGREEGGVSENKIAPNHLHHRLIRGTRYGNELVVSYRLER